MDLTISVVGLGKIGLPLAVQYALGGHTVLGCDVDAKVVESVNLGIEPFPGEKDLGPLLKRVVEAGRLKATLSTSSAVRKSNVTVVVVPVFIDQSGAPDLQHMKAATLEIGQGLQRDSLVVFETTLPMGTTRNVLVPLLESTSSMSAGTDFSVAYSPERVLTGRVFEDLRRYPKLVGGFDSRSTLKAVDFYKSVLDFDDRQDLSRANGVWELGSLEAAELAKLMETTYRDVNIALANQFAVFAEKMGVDIYSVIEACNSQPYSHVHKPGVAVGGHCIPIYPRLYLSGDPDASVVLESRITNEKMPDHVVDRLERVFGSLEGQEVLILGASYRGQVKETAFSGVFPLVDALQDRGAQAKVHDPLYSREELELLGLRGSERGEGASAVILQADHTEYRDWGPEDVPGVQVFLDGRNVTQATNWQGVLHLTLGVGDRLSDTPPRTVG